MSTSDGRPFCIGVRMIQSLTLQQVYALYLIDNHISVSNAHRENVAFNL